MSLLKQSDKVTRVYQAQHTLCKGLGLCAARRIVGQVAFEDLAKQQQPLWMLIEVDSEPVGDCVAVGRALQDASPAQRDLLLPKRNIRRRKLVLQLRYKFEPTLSILCWPSVHWPLEFHSLSDQIFWTGPKKSFRY